MWILFQWRRKYNMENINRTRRLRANPAIRAMVRETKLSIDDFIYPLFVVEGNGIINDTRGRFFCVVK
jgi:delta-aminolevulinic acid dehydratase/porphobilinogen synthase